MKGGIKMNKNRLGLVVICFVFITLLIVNVSAFQFRPMNHVNHPGLTEPFQSDGYDNTFNGISKLCEAEHALDIRPMNQGFNILRFFHCCQFKY